MVIPPQTVAYPEIGKRGAKPKGAAPDQGRKLPREAAFKNVFFFFGAAGNRCLQRIICYIIR